MRDLWILFSTFFRIGLFTVGGGYAMLPMLKREVVEKYGWLTDEDLLNIYAIGQSTPGIIAINTATFVGFRRKGILGGIAATAGMVGPSLVIITAIALSVQNLSQFEIVDRAFSGVRAVVAMLLMFVIIDFCRKGLKDAFGVLLAVTAFVLIGFGLAPVIWVVLGGGILGMVFYTIKAVGKAPAVPAVDIAPDAEEQGEDKQ